MEKELVRESPGVAAPLFAASALRAPVPRLSAPKLRRPTCRLHHDGCTRRDRS
jgi:hypothetical protein